MSLVSFVQLYSHTDLANTTSTKANLVGQFKDTRIKKYEKKRTVVKDTRLKQKIKSTKTKGAGGNIKLAKLEKMYQELSEMEAK